MSARAASEALDRAADNALAWLRSCGHLAGCEAVEQGTPEFEQLVAKLRAADIRFRRLNDRPAPPRFDGAGPRGRAAGQFRSGSGAQVTARIGSWGAEVGGFPSRCGSG